MTFFYFLHHRTETSYVFRNFFAEMRTLGHGNVQRLRNDNGTEYYNKEFYILLNLEGIQQQLSSPYTLEQNGIEERANRKLIEKARCMISYASIPESYWAEAVRTGAYLKNKIPIGGSIERIPE